MKEKELIKKIKDQIKHKNKIKPSTIFGDGFAAKKISKILEKINVKIQKKITY